jgi:hypothetical protein
VEEELPPKFLGYQLFDEGFMLSRKSYLQNFYLNERGPYTVFRPYPHLGIVLRRTAYQVQGEPFITTDIIPWEDETWPKYGLSMDQVYKRAADESRFAMMDFSYDERIILEKEYQLTEEEKAKLTSRFTILGPDVTSRMIKQMIDPKWKLAF